LKRWDQVKTFDLGAVSAAPLVTNASLTPRAFSASTRNGHDWTNRRRHSRS